MAPGDRVHKLTLDERVRVGRRSGWICRCDCGGARTFLETNILSGSAFSCGCVRQPRLPKSAATVGGRACVGARFGRMVVESVGPGTFRNCLCDCGNRRVVRGGNLTNGATRSCGCLNLDTRKTCRRTHGNSGSAVYRIWNGLTQRCTNANNPAWEDYGGRGIDVCEAWLSSFETFATHMGERPSKKHSIDRVDNERGYHCGRCPDCESKGRTPNCRWATQKEQMRNNRRNVWLTVGDETLLMTDWAKRSGISRQLISQRINAGWDEESAVMLPADPAASAKARANGLGRHQRKAA